MFVASNNVVSESARIVDRYLSFVQLGQSNLQYLRVEFAGSRRCGRGSITNGQRLVRTCAYVASRTFTIFSLDEVIIKGRHASGGICRGVNLNSFPVFSSVSFVQRGCIAELGGICLATQVFVVG